MIPGLDGLRAIAFLLVFAIHANYLQIGWVGVQLFFVLSGFLITGILLDMKEKLPIREYFIKFYGRRFLRIFPLYYLYLFLMLMLTILMAAIGYKPNLMRIFQDQVWYAVLYLYDFFSASAGFKADSFLIHFWSLSVEEQFYIFWPLLVLLTPEKSLKKLFLAGIFAGPALRIALYVIHRFGSFAVFRDPVPVFVYPLPFSHIDAFALGAYISRYSIPFAKKQLLPLSLAIPVLGFSSRFMATGEIGEFSALGFSVTLPHAYQFIWAYSLLNYWFAIIIFCVVYEKMLLHFLEWPPLQYLGRISYGLYVYHVSIMWFVGRLQDLGILVDNTKPVIAIISLAVTVSIASISYFLLEKPLIDLKDRFFSLKSST